MAERSTDGAPRHVEDYLRGTLSTRNAAGNARAELLRRFWTMGPDERLEVVLVLANLARLEMGPPTDPENWRANGQ